MWTTIRRRQGHTIGLIVYIVAVLIFCPSCRPPLNPDEARAATDAADLLDTFKRDFPESDLLLSTQSAAEEGDRSDIGISVGLENVCFAAFLVYGVDSTSTQDEILSKLHGVIEKEGVTSPVLIDFYSQGERRKGDGASVNTAHLTRRIVAKMPGATISQR